MSDSGWLSALDLANTWASNTYQSAEASNRQHDAQDFSREMYTNRYQYQVEDLKRAGLNPMMAYQSGAPSSPTASAASASGQPSRAADVYNQSRIASAQEANINQQTINLATEKKKTEADTENSLLQQNLLQADYIVKTKSASQIAAYENHLRVQMQEQYKNIELLTEKIKTQKADTANVNALAEANRQLSELRSQQTALTMAETSITQTQKQILEPKAFASQLPTAYAGHVAEDVGKIGDAFWKFTPKPKLYQGRRGPNDY